MIEISDELRQAVNTHLDDDDFDPRVGMAMMNAILAEDDKDDPYLESYGAAQECMSPFAPRTEGLSRSERRQLR